MGDLGVGSLGGIRKSDPSSRRSLIETTWANNIDILVIIRRGI